MRAAIEAAVPHGRTEEGGRNDQGAWFAAPEDVVEHWAGMSERFAVICAKHPKIEKSNNVRHLGTLGTGNHFIEICLDETDHVWIMLHSGSRGCGNRIGTYFIQRAKKEMERWYIQLPDTNLA